MSDRFSLVLFTVLSLTLLCGLLATVIAWQNPNPATHPMQVKLFDTSVALLHAGIGAIIGLLGGHAV